MFFHIVINQNISKFNKKYLNSLLNKIINIFIKALFKLPRKNYKNFLKIETIFTTYKSMFSSIQIIMDTS